jgi:RNA polymerase sigma factor (sigma-70 family)
MVYRRWRLNLTRPPKVFSGPDRLLIGVNMGSSSDGATAARRRSEKYRTQPVMPARDDSTSTTLLGRLVLNPPDQTAWNEFVERYGQRIFQWCRAWGLQEADVLDVSQAVLAKLSVQLRRFEYDPSRSFRGWLRTLARGAAHDALAARGRVVGAGTSEARELLASLEARDDLVHRLEAEFDIELVDAATELVRQRVAPKSWEAYHLTVREGRPAADVATELGMRIGAVSQAKSRLMQMLQDEVRKLEDSGDQGREPG